MSSTHTPDIARTQKRAKSCFQFFMRFHNINENLYITWGLYIQFCQPFYGMDTECEKKLEFKLKHVWETWMRLGKIWSFTFTATNAYGSVLWFWLIALGLSPWSTWIEIYKWPKTYLHRHIWKSTSLFTIVSTSKSPYTKKGASILW